MTASAEQPRIGSCLGLKAYGPGANDREIRFGQTMSYSGPNSAFSVLGKVADGYFRKVNDEGGINGRKLHFISYDDAYNPAKTVEQDPPSSSKVTTFSSHLRRLRSAAPMSAPSVATSFARIQRCRSISRLPIAWWS